MARTKQQVKQDILSFLRANGIMTLATSSQDRPWVCTVYYGVDNQMSLYLVTGPNTKHGKELSKNPNVASNIFDSHQKITRPKKGLQGAGKCEVVKGVSAVTKALQLWHKANPGIEAKITVKDILKKITGTKIYRIKPKYLKFFNEKLYGSDEYGTFGV